MACFTHYKTAFTRKARKPTHFRQIDRQKIMHKINRFPFRF